MLSWSTDSGFGAAPSALRAGLAQVVPTAAGARRVGQPLVDRPTMRAHAYSVLRTILTSASEDELIGANPARIRGAGRTNRVHKVKPDSVEEIATLANAMPERLQLMVLLASWCALRFGETVELSRGDVDLGAEVIHIRRAAVRINGTFEVGTPKSDASVRDVTIPPHLVPVIGDHLAEHVGKKRDSLLFPAVGVDRPDGNPIHSIIERHLQPSTLSRHWYKACASIGRDDLRWHDLRHSGAVLAAATGASLAELMAAYEDVLAREAGERGQLEELARDWTAR